jgi:hypothetical protein
LLAPHRLADRGLHSAGRPLRSAPDSEDLTADDVQLTTPEAILRDLIAKLEPADQKLFRSVRTALRKRALAANELLYDYGHSVVISYTATEHGKDGVLALSAKADGLRLYFNQWRRLKDPKKLLQGTATQVRFIKVEAARQLTQADVKALITAAVAGLPTKGRGKLMDRSAAQKERRRKETK